MSVLLSVAILAVSKGRTFYFSPVGNDQSSGRTAAKAWRSLSKLAGETLQAGDEIVLATGEYDGHIDLGSGGTKDRPIVVRSDPSHPATLISEGGTAIKAMGGGIEIRNLIVKGNATRFVEKQGGISFASPEGIKSRLPGVLIQNVDVSTFADAGISIGALDKDAMGFESVTIEHVSSHDNFGSGIETWDSSSFLSKGWAHRRLHLVDCDASHNRSGTGIVLSGFDGGLIEFCRASGNTGKGGGVGIWAWCARNLTFRYCIASGTRSGGGDGGGFDLDGGTQNCVIERSLAYENSGPGYMHCDYPAAPPTTGNVFRNCVSVNDGRKPRGENIGFGFVTWGAGLDDCHIDGNLTLVDIDDVKARDQGLLFVSYIEGATKPSDVLHVRSSTFRNNLSVVLGKGIAYVNDRLPSENSSDVRYEGNRFAASPGLSPVFLKGGSTPMHYSSLSDWQQGPGKSSRRDNAPEAAKWISDYRTLDPRQLPESPLIKAALRL